MNMAYSLAMGAAKDLPPGARYHVVLEGADPDNAGNYTATAHVVILEAGGAEAPELDVEAEAAEARRRHEKEELELKLKERGVSTEALELAGLSLEELLDIINEPSLSDEIAGQWFAAAELFPALEDRYHVPDIPRQTYEELASMEGRAPPEGEVEFVPPVIHTAEEASLREKIEAEAKTIFQEYVTGRVLEGLTLEPGQQAPAREELERIAKIATRELAENVINSVFRLGGPLAEQEQSLAYRLAENMLMDGLIESLQPALRRTRGRQPRLDTLDLVA